MALGVRDLIIECESRGIRERKRRRERRRNAKELLFYILFPLLPHPVHSYLFD